MATEDAPLAGKVVLITGGSRGAGLATARKLGTAGAAVSLVARDWATLNAAVDGLVADGITAMGRVGDVTDPTDMDAAVVATEQEYGGLDVLVNNAGIGRYGPVAEMPPDEWQQVIEVNLLGVFNATRVALPALRRRGGGQIIAISSGAARQGYPNMSAYCSSKAALEGFMRALAAEVEHEPIKCATIVPGRHPDRLRHSDPGGSRRAHEIRREVPGAGGRRGRHLLPADAAGAGLDPGDDALAEVGVGDVYASWTSLSTT